MSDAALLKVGGKAFGGWESVRVTRSIESIAGSFEFAASERWANQDQPWAINEGDECTVSVNGETVISGYVDAVKPSFNASSHTFAVSGRDKTGDLVDCSALPRGPFEFKGLTLTEFARKICAPHGITVSLQSGVRLPAAPKKHAVDPGETGFRAIEEACRSAGVLPVSDGSGGLALVRAGSTRATTDLIQGKNILSASAAFDASGRFASYVVLGQHAANDELFGRQAARVKGSATDPNVKRSARVLVVRPEGNVTVEHAKRRAEWEASVRAARSSTLTVTVQGWTQASGKIWPVNALVRVRAPALRIDGELLITQATYSIDSGSGTTTELQLKRPDSFKPEPQVSKDTAFWPEIAKGV